MTTIVVTGCNILDLVKKMALYNKPLDTKAVDAALFKLDLHLEVVMFMFGLPRAAVLGANIEKLRKRYGEKYSDEAAQQRADKQGRSFIGKDRHDIQDERI